MRLNAGRYRDFERSIPSPLEQGGTSASHEKREGRLGEFDERVEERGGEGVTTTSHDTASPLLPPLSIGPCVLFFSSGP